MSINEFLSKNNIELLRDVILDENIFRNRTNDEMIKLINIIFNKIIKQFYENEKNKFKNLIEMNKQFIKIIINYININFPIQQNTQTNLHNNNNNNNLTSSKNLITSEDIQQNRLSQFEKELNIKQQEFTNAITLPVPPTPNFSDKLDEPISEMGMAIKQMMAQRNYDIEMFNNTINKNDSSNWLQSQETSIKNDRINKSTIENNTNIDTNTNMNINSNTTNNKIKYIKIDNKDIDFNIQNEAIDLNKKQLSWSDTNETIEYNTLESIKDNNNDNNNNIFKKLKFVSNNDNNYVKTNENRIAELENKVDTLNGKIDMILKLLENKNTDNFGI